ncbi:substrate-binding domain-containing protein [Celeribacter sp. ULVN23_4]
MWNALPREARQTAFLKQPDIGVYLRHGRVEGINPEWWNRARRQSQPLKIGLLVPFCGADAIWGPSCQCSAVLAASELNGAGGILGRQIELLAADAGGDPAGVVARARELVDVHGAQVLIGVHLSTVRLALAEEFAGEIPYVYAPLFEGGAPREDVFTIGETPENQFAEALLHMIRSEGAKRWYLIGNDYVWPRASHDWVRRFLHKNGAEVVGESYVPIGETNIDTMLDRIAQAGPDIVFQSLVGAECVPFNREFSARGMSANMLRLSGAIEENTLLAIGPDATENLYCAAGYFSEIDGPDNSRFMTKYRDAFGVSAPMQGVLSEACYEGLHFFAALAGRANSLNLPELRASFEGLHYSGARGTCVVRDGVCVGPVYLAQADGARFRILQSF